MTATTLHARQALLADGWHNGVRVTIDAGQVTAIVSGVAVAPTDERHDTLLPGLANLHSHAFQRVMAGRTEVRGAGTDSFWSWRDLMYRTALTLSPDDVQAIAAQAYVEMLEAGFTRVAEFHYLHHDRDGRPYANIAEMAERIAAAADASGLRLTLLPVRYVTGGFGGQPPADGQRRFITSRDQYARLHEASRTAIAGLDGAVLGVAPHSLRAVTLQELDATLALAGDGPRHIHVAEQTKEVDDCLAWSGHRPVQWLMQNAAVDSRWCLIHATHIDADESASVADCGAVVGLCPLTEANLGDGIFPAPGFRAQGGRFGIGTDQNAEIGVTPELRMLEYSQRLATRTRNVLAPQQASTGRALFEAALAGGAQATGAAAVHLAGGGPADLVTLAPRHDGWPTLQGDAMLDAWIFSNTVAVDAVYVGGRRRVAGGRHHARERVAAAFAKVLARLLAGN